MTKVNRTHPAGPSARPAAQEALSAADRTSILKMIANELKKGSDSFAPARGRGTVAPKYMVHGPGGGGGPIVAKYMVRPPVSGGGGAVAPKYMVHGPGGGGGPIVAKYMIRPPVSGGGGTVAPKYMVPGPGGGGGPVVAKYMVVPPGVVPMYIAVPPWAGVDAHQAVINTVSADGKVSKKEAMLLRKLFNRDIQEAKKDGKDIRPKVAAYLHKVLDRLELDKTSNQLVFGAGGPGYLKPDIAAKYMVRGPLH